MEGGHHSIIKKVNPLITNIYRKKLGRLKCKRNLGFSSGAAAGKCSRIITSNGKRTELQILLCFGSLPKGDMQYIQMDLSRTSDKWRDWPSLIIKRCLGSIWQHEWAELSKINYIFWKKIVDVILALLIVIFWKIIGIVPEIKATEGRRNSLEGHEEEMLSRQWTDKRGLSLGPRN